MKLKLLTVIQIVLIFWGTNERLTGQTSDATNIGFEAGSFTGWTGYTWLYSTEVPSINTSKKKGIVSRRQTIISDTTAYDSNTGGALKKVPSGYTYSARLGDEIKSSDSNPRGWEQSLSYSMTVDSSNALLIVKFACVLQYASDHTAKMEPRFRMTLFDKNGDTIPDCSNYDVYSSSSYVKGFNTYTPSSSSNNQNSSSPVKWRDWTTVGANLISYIGQTITIEFMSADCTGKYHYGYAYFVAETHPLYITVKYCSGDSVATLTAPEGFESYSWYNSSSVLVDTTKTINISNPNEGDVYTCSMVSATGCTVSLSAVIAKYVLTPDFTSQMIDCKSNTVKFTNLSTTTHGTLEYKWVFDDSVTSTTKDPKHTFATSGLHNTTLILTNPPSTCTDTVTKIVESFSPPLVGIEGDSTYCPELTTTLKGYGAYYYTWSTGETADSIEVGDPGGDYWMLGHSSTGCVSDTAYQEVTEEPDWTFSGSSDTTFCKGDSALLSVSGAYTYLWNNGDTISSFYTQTPGNYEVYGYNKRGCEKSFTYNVIEYPLPLVNFELSTYKINSKNNQITGYISPETNTQYLWNMGDGNTYTNNSIQHTYSITTGILKYDVELKAESEYSCIDSLTQIVEVEPYVPNVFSPNGDGINDYFMTGYDVQIMDRNGMELYHGESGWDGKYDGKQAAADTYFYILRYSDKNGNTHIKKGYVTLVK